MVARATVCHGGALDRKGQATDRLYDQALARGQRGQLKSGLTGRERFLLDLASVEANCPAHARHDVGLRTVPITQICGSESRIADFDRDFNPLQDYTRERWLGVAAAHFQGRALPPVELVQVGQVYFVRDGHHRISVARALGQQSIEAKVLVWEATGLLPWEEPFAGRETAGVGRLAGGVRDDSAAFRKRLLAGFRNLLIPLRARIKARAIS